MRLASRRALIATAFVCAIASGANAVAADYTTFHFDNARDGWNDQETQLNQADAGRLTEYGRYRLDGEVDAQPLYLHGEYVPSERDRDNVVYVVTENDTVYAISPRRGILWSRHFGMPVGTAYVGNCKATSPVIGIQGTPVIDRARDAMYFVSFTIARGRPDYTLHEIDPGTGADKASVDLSASVVVPGAHRQRAGLLESDGNVYVAFAGFCDHQVDRSYGRILAYTAASLQFKYAFVTTASPACGDFHLGTIWALGFAPAADRAGQLYFSTGNGCIDYTRTRLGGYADAVLRLTPDLRLVSTTTALFAPCRAFIENRHDQEMGSGGVILPRGTRFAVAGGKTGVTYVLDRYNLGGFHTPCPDHAAFEASTNWGVWGGPAVWKSGSQTYVVIPGSGPQGIREYALDPGTGALKLRSQTGEALRNGGESVIVTSDASGSRGSAVLWALTRPTTGEMYLQAYDALDLRRRLLSVAAGSWSNEYGYAGVSPTVADGFVFVATDKQLTIWSCCEAGGPSSRLGWAMLAAVIAASALAARRWLKQKR